jgi:hypothetical protein
MTPKVLPNAGDIPAEVFLPNANDQLVIEKLRTAPIGELAIDLLMPDASRSVREFRNDLYEMYFDVAIMRASSKAIKDQFKSAKSALLLLENAVKNLEKVNPEGWDGLRLVLEGPPLDDKKGEFELNDFASACGSIKLAVTRICSALESAIWTEESKPRNAGERRKRLRTLVDALADWWLSNGGSLAPTVDANRRDEKPAVVHGRRGDFLAFALALFCKVDEFKETEVEAAVTNVHEERLAATKACAGN